MQLLWTTIQVHSIADGLGPGILTHAGQARPTDRSFCLACLVQTRMGNLPDLHKVPAGQCFT